LDIISKIKQRCITVLRTSTKGARSHLLRLGDGTIFYARIGVWR